MFCVKCGTKLPDDARFCSTCGYAFEGVNTGNSIATQINIPKAETKDGNSGSSNLEYPSNFINLEDTKKSGKESKETQVGKKKKKWLIPVIITGSAVLILAIVAAVTISIIVVGTASKQKYQKQLDLGEKYLSERDYENAILAYQDAVQDDPKSEDAYLGLSHVYETMADNYRNQGDLDKAIENLDEEINVLTEGFNKTTSEEFKREQERIEKKKEEFEKEEFEKENQTLEIIDEEEEQTLEIIDEEEKRTFEIIGEEEIPGGVKDLESFLSHFCWAASEWDSSDSGEHRDIVDMMLMCPYTICDPTQYADYIQVPENMSDDGFFHFKADGVDWVLTNIFNFSEEDLTILKNEYSQAKSEYDRNGFPNEILYANGEYWVPPGGVGGDPMAEVKEVQTDGEKYRITYDTYWYDYLSSEGGYYYDSTYYALMEYKIIDGEGYWSLYKVSETNFFEENTEK